MWVTERWEHQLPIAKKTKFYNIFYTRFNLGFDQPKCDVCATCKTLFAATKQGSADERAAASAKYTLHDFKWRRSYKFLEEARIRHNTLAMVFDLQQTMPLPLTSITQAFYKRQV